MALNLILILVVVLILILALVLVLPDGNQSRWAAHISHLYKSAR